MSTQTHLRQTKEIRMSEITVWQEVKMLSRQKKVIKAYRLITVYANNEQFAALIFTFFFTILYAFKLVHPKLVRQINHLKQRIERKMNKS